MDTSHLMTRRERLLRIAAGLGMLVAGFVIFSLSKAYDPSNRAAILAIIAIFFGLTWIGQAIRGHRDLVPHHEVKPLPGVEATPSQVTAGIALAWLVPGLGHWIVGRRRKALLFFGVISATFLAGVLLAQGRNLSYERDSVYFLAYMFNAGETAIGWLLARGLEFDHDIPHIQVGFLYTAVACLLNIVVVIDFFNTCMRGRAAGGAEGAQ